MAELDGLLEKLSYSLEELDIPGFELNFNHFMEMGKGNEDCIFGFYWLMSHNATGHAHIVLIPQLQKPIEEWPVAFYDDEHGTAYTFASSLKTWFPSYLIYSLNKWYPIYRKDNKYSWVKEAKEALKKHKAKIIKIGKQSPMDFEKLFSEVEELVAKKNPWNIYEWYKKVEPNSYLTEYYRLKDNEASIEEWKKYIKKNPHFNKPLYDLLFTEDVNLDNEDPTLDIDLCHEFWNRFWKVDMRYYKILPAVVKRIMSEKKKSTSPYMPLIEKIHKVIVKDPYGYYHGTEGFFEMGEVFEKKKDYAAAITCYSNAIMLGRTETEEYHEPSYERILVAAKNLGDKNYLAYLSETVESSDEDVEEEEE